MDKMINCGYCGFEGKQSTMKHVTQGWYCAECYEWERFLGKIMVESDDLKRAKAYYEWLSLHGAVDADRLRTILMFLLQQYIKEASH